jgi:hypothetical protein
MSMYEFSVPQFKKMLANLDQWLEKAVGYAQSKSFEPDLLAQARLAPDQYPLARQVQGACDAAKFAAARLSGKEAPRHPDTEQTIEELRARIRSCTAFLDTVSAADMAGAETRRLQLPFAEGKVAIGQSYLIDLALPNFYFHVTTAYAILRHNGVNLGKLDFLGSVTMQDA